MSCFLGTQIHADYSEFRRGDGNTDFTDLTRISRKGKNADFGKGATIVSIVLPTRETLLATSFSNTIIKMKKDAKDITPGAGLHVRRKRNDDP